jgi:hypothetical protein
MPRDLCERPTPVPWPLSVAAAAVILFSAVLLYAQFRQAAPSLWDNSAHDRNGHYGRSLNMAIALRHGSLAAVVKEIHAATVWPPLHPLVTGLMLAIGGLDYRLAVLTSLGAWAATCWFVFALATRLVSRYRGFAGCVALLFALASPAYRAYATDIMIESLGAALATAALYFYVTARQEQSAWRGRCLALLLLALFLTKYNYWTLLVAGLLCATAGEVGPFLLAALRARRPFDWRQWLSAQLRHPVNYLLPPAFALALYVRLVGGVTLTLLGRSVTIGSLAFPAELCFVLLLLRALPWWWRQGRPAIARLSVPARQLVHWLVYPLVLWFLWPLRLSVFLWYVTFTHHGRTADTSHWLGSFPYYWQSLAHEYHANLASLLLVLALIGLAILGRRRWMTGTSAVFICLAVAALLTNYHSANRSRFLHSWLAVGWAAAGAGAALAVERVAERAASRMLRPALLAGAAAGLAVCQGTALLGPGHSEEGGTLAGRPNLLGLADAVVPALADTHAPALVADAPFESLLNWRLGEDRGAPCRLLTPPHGLFAPAPQEQFKEWLRGHSCDAVLLIDAPFPPVMPTDSPLDVGRVREFLASSGEFALSSEWHDAGEMKIAAQVWRRITAADDGVRLTAGLNAAR